MSAGPELSEALAEEDLTDLAVALLCWPDGRSRLLFRSNLTDADFAAYLRQTADYVEEGRHREALAEATTSEGVEHG